jgi:hypothetical protein
LIALAWALRRRAPLISCGIFWFFVGHSMEATVVPLELMFEHRNYLPSFGIIVAVIGGLATRELPFSPRAGIAAACSVLGIYGLVTYSIVADWRDGPRMYAAFYHSHPHSPFAASQMAELLTADRRFDEARAVLASIPGTGPRIHQWFLECRQSGKLNEARMDPSVLDLDKTITTYTVTGLIELTNLSLDGKCQMSPAKLRMLLTKATERPIVITGNRQKLTVYIAHLAWRAEDFQGAFANLRQAFALKPKDPMPLFLMSEWKALRNDQDGARRALASAERVALLSGRDYSKTISSLRRIIGNPVPGSAPPSRE